jgi:hypothetical protein
LTTVLLNFLPFIYIGIIKKNLIRKKKFVLSKTVKLEKRDMYKCLLLSLGTVSNRCLFGQKKNSLRIPSLFLSNKFGVRICVDLRGL